MKLSGALACGILALAAPRAVLAQDSFQPISLTAGEQRLPALYRPALATPARYRVIFIPGSGCTDMQPIADRYFRGLLHAEVLVLQKPGVTPSDQPCTPEFVRHDALKSWAATAGQALRSASPTTLPQLLVGASEGAEILPYLSPQITNLRGLVMISSAGLDPRETLALQARRLGAEAAYREIGAAVASDQDDLTPLQGRTLKYWRDLWNWRVTEYLLVSPVPVIQVWGGNDSLIPAEAYQRFATLAVDAQPARPPGKPPYICSERLAQADHGLQSRERDGLQWLWAKLEQWARIPNSPPCAALSTHIDTAGH
ncbi:MAG: hypothetical protein PHH47_03470 [Gallionella sp.]|nr:hypothetical protein [Gallionella sp.]MDD4946227.1 hypothetical protein [Gallionella sp.]MDD5612520.1 hypothetical protein [Gallionella sp.]